MKRLTWLALPLLALPLVAQATDGYTTGNVNLRAGPDIGYPLLDTIPAGAPLQIMGCTGGWAWCDVVFEDERGWIAGNFIQYEYDDRTVLVPQYGAQIGIPVVSFVISSYWDDHYRNRPFYRERSRWYARPVPHRPPPPPMRHPLPPRHDNRPYQAVPHQAMPQRPPPARPLPDRHALPMPQRPRFTPEPSEDTHRQTRGAPHTPPANHAAPRPAHESNGRPDAHGKAPPHGQGHGDDHDHHDP